MKPISYRTDIASRKPYPKDSLLRLVLVGGRVTVDKAGVLPGRGSYLFPSLEAYETALRKHAFERSFRRPLTEDEASAIKEAL